MTDSLNPPRSRQTHETMMSGWISRPDLAQQLGVTEDTLRRWNAARSGPPCIRAGRKIYYRRSGVQDWLDDLERLEQAGTRRRRAGGRK